MFSTCFKYLLIILLWALIPRSASEDNAKASLVNLPMSLNTASLLSIFAKYLCNGSELSTLPLRHVWKSGSFLVKTFDPYSAASSAVTLVPKPNIFNLPAVWAISPDPIRALVKTCLPTNAAVAWMPLAIACPGTAILSML